MSFRTRLALAAAAAVALAVVLASVIVFVVVRSELRAELDDALRDRAEEISDEPPDRVARALFGRGPGFGGAEGYPQLVEEAVAYYQSAARALKQGRLHSAYHEEEK